MYLVGADPPRSARALAARDARFVATGFADDVRPYVAEASFFVCPITEGGGTKLKVLNAMAMGKVVIADPIACEGIRVTDGQHALLASSPADYVGQARALLNNPSKYLAVARAARELIEAEYSYEVIGHELDRQYRAVRETFGPER
jgi:glycosyltransferase involved in cell wall biosynthesis